MKKLAVVFILMGSLAYFTGCQTSDTTAPDATPTMSTEVSTDATTATDTVTDAVVTDAPSN